MAVSEPTVAVYEPGSPEAVRVDAILHPERYRALADPFGLDALDLSAFELPALDPLPPFDWP